MKNIKCSCGPNELMFNPEWSEGFAYVALRPPTGPRQSVIMSKAEGRRLHAAIGRWLAKKPAKKAKER